MIVSDVSIVVFHIASRRLIYTVLVPFNDVNVCDLVGAHNDQFVGDEVFQKATSTHHAQVSTGHVIFNVTFCDGVAISQLFIVKVHHMGC